MKLLLDMYKSAPKEQRDKVQLMAAERKSKAEVCSSWHHNFAHFFFALNINPFLTCKQANILTEIRVLYSTYLLSCLA